MSDELVLKDDLGLKFDPAEFSYASPQRRGPQPGNLYSRPDITSQLGSVPVISVPTAVEPAGCLSGPDSTSNSLPPAENVQN